MRERQKVVSLASMKEHSLLQFYISREWLNKFNTFAEPGPITNHTFLCPHGGKAVLLGWEEQLSAAPFRFGRKAPAVILIQCTLQQDLLLWQKLQPAQGEVRQ